MDNALAWCKWPMRQRDSDRRQFIYNQTLIIELAEQKRLHISSIARRADIREAEAL
jgi:hypothetical protein